MATIDHRLLRIILQQIYRFSPSTFRLIMSTDLDIMLIPMHDAPQVKEVLMEFGMLLPKEASSMREAFTQVERALTDVGFTDPYNPGAPRRNDEIALRLPDGFDLDLLKQHLSEAQN